MVDVEEREGGRRRGIWVVVVVMEKVKREREVVDVVGEMEDSMWRWTWW